MRHSYLAAIVPCIALLSGCASLGDWVPGSAGQPPLAPDEQVEARTIVSYLSTLDLIEHSTADKQAAIAESLRTAQLNDPSVQRRLRYAFYLAVPGHPASDSDAARELLAGVISGPDELLPSEHALAGFFVRMLDARAQPTQVVAPASRPATNDKARIASLRKELQQESLENDRLRRELDVALAKLAAIAALEGSTAAKRTDSKPPP